MEQDRRWRQNPFLEALSAEVRGWALDFDLRADEVARRIRSVARRTGEIDAARWAAARGLDQALATCHPLLDAPAGAGRRSELERRIRRRYTRTGRFDSGAVSGALLPKFVESGRRGEATANREQAYA